jgi:chromosome segregation ATPase
VNESDYVFFTYDFVPCPSFKSSRLSVVDESIQLINEAQEFINHPNLLKAISEGLGGYDASQLQIVENVLRYADSEYFSDIITEVQERVVAGNVRDGVTSLLEEAHQQIKSLKDEIFRLSEGRDTSSDLELERRLRRCIEQDLSDISERTYFLMDAVADVSLQLSSARETVNESQEIVEEKEQEVSELRHELSEVQTKSTRISADYLSTFALLEKKEAQTSKVMQEAKRLDERMDTLYEEISTQRLRAENYAKLLKESIVNAFALPLNEVEKLLPEGFTKEDFDVVVAKLKARVPGSTSLVERKTSVKAITEEKNIAQEESVAISLLKNIRK